MLPQGGRQGGGAGLGPGPGREKELKKMRRERKLLSCGQGHGINLIRGGEEER